MKISDKIILFFFLAALLYLWSNVCVAYGVLKERQNSLCIMPYQVDQWKSVINVAEKVYTNVSQSYNSEIDKTKQEAQHWRDSYFQLKKQTDQKQLTLSQ